MYCHYFPIESKKIQLCPLPTFFRAERINEGADQQNISSAVGKIIRTICVAGGRWLRRVPRLFAAALPFRLKYRRKFKSSLSAIFLGSLPSFWWNKFSQGLGWIPRYFFLSCNPCASCYFLRCRGSSFSWNSFVFFPVFNWILKVLLQPQVLPASSLKICSWSMKSNAIKSACTIFWGGHCNS